MMVAHAIPGYVTVECFGVATVSVRGRLERSTDRGPAPPSIPASAAGAAAIRALTADPWRRAPNTVGVGDRPLFVPPWALLVWTARDGSQCYEPGQYVDARTPGRSDQLPDEDVSRRGRTRGLRGIPMTTAQPAAAG